MKKMKKLWAIILAVLLMLCMGIGLFGCRPYPWEIAEKEVFDAANKIARHPDYALIDEHEYRSAEKTIIWKDLIIKKIKSDGKRVESTACYTCPYLKEPNTLEGGFISFSCNYSNEFNWFGLNKNNCNHAIGIMSLDDYSFEIHYFSLPYSQFYILKVSETHFCCYTEEDNKAAYLLINRKNGKIEEKWENFDLVKENFKDEILPIHNHSTYTENGIEYTVGRSYVKNAEENISIRLPSYEYVMERSPELQQINEVAKANDNTVSSIFITNGTELFIVYSHEMGMMGSRCHLIPVVFRCDTSLETFEYVGCLSHATYYPENYITIIKTN
ncbi:MAG: hypothetical protein IKD47_04565 [Clostridia bacterium]|nr:hypothetical protein [Clostridia bacterium]